MKRLRVDESTLKEVSGNSLPSGLYHQTLHSATSTLAYPTPGAVKVVSEGMQTGIYSSAPVSYTTLPAAAAPHSVKPQVMQPLTVGGHSQLRVTSAASPPTGPMQPEPPQPPQQQSPGGGCGGNFQRLKVDDALSYLDLVKYKFGSKPQVYNDFLDIMKEFKSQSIDTPGVIQRVSTLFKGFPELIVGFNAFLPPGYKIEVQRSDRGYAFEVSVSLPSPTSSINSDPTQQKQMIMRGTGTINVMGASQPPMQPVPPPPPPSIGLPVAQHTNSSGSQPAPAAPAHHAAGYVAGNSIPSYNALSLSAAQAAVSQALQGHTDSPQNQPVEFNHAINYVNKIKNRFQGQPEKYKRFLEILHTYQKEQRTLKETTGAAAGGNSGGGGGGKHLTEQEVYSQVAKLFENQSDLLAEFGQFLPDATSHINQAPINDHGGGGGNSLKKPPVKPSSYRDHAADRHGVSGKPSHVASSVKRSPPYSSGLAHRDREGPPLKKHKSSSCKDVTLAEASKYGALQDYAFFDKVRKAIRNPDVYENFLRCLTLFNQEVISKSELIQLVTSFLNKYPELLRWFREFLGQGTETEPVPFNSTRNERPQGDQALEIDLTTAKRLGASYCVIPPSQEGLRCSGRTTLCKEVLNDQWVSFPTWSEDSTFVSSRKTQYEEYMYRCEDERFELDVVIETNSSTIRILEGVQKKMGRMSSEELSKFRLDDCLGGNTPSLHQRALKRIYGDKAGDIIDGLKRNPFVAVPVVLRRLKAKEQEWREAQKGFNKIWREQNEKYYLKSLDHQGINFKQTDVKALRSKSLFNEIEAIFDERHEQNEEGTQPAIGPHLVLQYKDRTILDDAANLLVHHVKRQTGIQKGEKRRIKHLLFQFLPDLFFHPRQPLSEDEREDEDDKEDESPGESPGNNKSKMSPGKSPGRSNDCESSDVKMETDEDIKVPLHAQTNDPEEAYTLFMANNNWYIFLRLHAILCDRLAKIYERAVVLAAAEVKAKGDRKESTAVALRLKPKPHIEVEDYYPAFLDMVKNLLDGNMDANTYEDTLREMFGIHAYVAFTLDKVVSYAVRQLQHCVTERTAISCTDLFLKEQKRGATGGQCSTAHRRLHPESIYQKEGEKAVQDENCFKIYIYKRDCRMTVELLDTEPDDTKKAEEAKKWSSYKDSYMDYTSANSKLRCPVYLDRNLRVNKRRNNVPSSEKKGSVSSRNADSAPVLDDGCGGSGGVVVVVDPVKRTSQDESEAASGRSEAKNRELLEELERKLNERSLPERNQSDHPGYEVADNAECKFNVDSSIMFTVNKDSYLYKVGALSKARKSHSTVTKRLSVRFRLWLKKWASSHVSDVQVKQCTDWLMGRGDGLVPNRTRVLTDNDLSRTPYVPYNRYRVDRLNETAPSAL